MNLLDLLSLTGVAFFAISGALAAGRRSLDLFGVLVIAAVAAVGGGTTRDLLLGRDVFWIREPINLVVILISALVTVVYARRYKPPTKLLFVADGLGLALFSIMGARIAQNEGLAGIVAVLMAIITGVAGGILRDVLSGEVPLILRRGHLYATAAAAGTALTSRSSGSAPRATWRRSSGWSRSRHSASGRSFGTSSFRCSACRTSRPAAKPRPPLTPTPIRGYTSWPAFSSSDRLLRRLDSIRWAGSMSSAGTRRSAGGRQKGARRAAGSAPRADVAPRTLTAFWLPSAMALLLASMSVLPRVQQNATLTRSVLAAALALIAWHLVLYLRVGCGATRTLTLAGPRAQHYVQALVQGSVYLYWGWHWRPVYEHMWLLVAQLVFAYAFDMLLSWSRRQSYTLGFGPFPIIFSTNLFLWFRDDWFYLQFALVGLGFLGKELIRWQREGKRVHIFNPSAFSLGLVSLILILTGTTSLTWGPEIASTLTLAPRIYAFLFLGGLVVMYFFSITLVAACAAATLFAGSALYAAVTGVPYFLDSEIPAAVFLGLHLLVTDPSTSPRTPVGKAMFGVMYGLGVFGLYGLLGAVGAPTFYDKLMCVPLLNLSVRWIDSTVAKLELPSLWRVWTLQGVTRDLNLATMAIWILFFGTMTALGRTDGRHAGDSLPFWEQACAENRPTACERLLQLENTYCTDNTGWACNELGVHYTDGRLDGADPERALTYFSKACELRFQAGCLNVLDPTGPLRASPRAFDLRLLLREGGKNLMEMPERDLYTRACGHSWSFACERVAAAG